MVYVYLSHEQWKGRSSKTDMAFLFHKNLQGPNLLAENCASIMIQDGS